MTGKQITPLQSTKNLLVKMETQFAAALPKQVPSKKFIRTVQTAISDPKIAEKINKNQLDKHTLLDSCMKAATDGLVLDGREAALLTFWSSKEKTNKAQYVPMVGGLLKKARNSGEIRSITAKVVYENDSFAQWVDENGEHFRHTPCDDSTKRGKPRKVYALGLTKDGGSQLEVLERADIDAIAAHSKNTEQYDPDKGQWFAEWWKKAAIRRVCKYLPSSADLDRLFEHDNENYDLNGHAEEEAVAEPSPAPEKKKTRAATIIEGELEGELVDTGTGEVYDERNPPPATGEEDYAEQEDDVI